MPYATTDTATEHELIEDAHAKLKTLLSARFARAVLRLAAERDALKRQLANVGRVSRRVHPC